MSSIWQFTIELFIGAAIRVIAFCVWLIEVILLGVGAIFLVVVLVIQLPLQQERAVLYVAVGSGGFYPRRVYVREFWLNVVLVFLNVFLLGVFFLLLVLSFTLKSR